MHACRSTLEDPTWRAATTEDLLKSVDELLFKLDAKARPRPADLAYTLSLAADQAPEEGPALAIVAGTVELLAERLRAARELLAGGAERSHQAQGIHLSTQPFAGSGRLAFVFPGQGSQLVDMGKDLAVMFTEAREALDQADELLASSFDQPLSTLIYPPPAFTTEAEKAQNAALTRTNIAQPALGAVEVAMLRLLGELGIAPDMAAGHSYGEFVALHAAGSIDYPTLLQLSEARGRFMAEASEGSDGGMAAVMAPASALAPLLENSDLTLANLNSPKQTVISGPAASIDRALEWCEENGLKVRRLPVASAFHSQLVASAQKRLAEMLEHSPLYPSALPVFSNTTGARYPRSVKEMSDLLSGQLARPVRWVDEIEAMYEDGARIFLEVGPRNILTGLIKQILGDRPHLAIPVDTPGRGGLTSVLNLAGALFVEGVSVDRSRLFRGRGVRRLDLAQLHKETGLPDYSPTTWMVSGAGVRPAGSPMKRAELPVPISLTPPGISAAGQTAPPQLPAAGQPAAGASLVPQSFQPPTTSPAGAGVLDHFQRVMQQFLRVQESVMMSALGGPAAPAAPQSLPAPAEAPVVQPAVAPTPVPELPAPSPVAAAPAVEEAPRPTPVMAREQISAHLLSIVSERTGYPVETLSVDAELEADLGVDSIKRVEIAGAINRVMADHFGDSADLEQLTGAQNLKAMIDVLDAFAAARTGVEPSPVEAPAAPAAGAPQPDSGLVERFTVHAVPAPLGNTPGGLNPEGVVVILDDSLGVAELLSNALAEAGWKSLRLAFEGLNQQEAAGYSAHRLEELRNTGPATALLDLRALGSERAPDTGEIEIFFDLAKALREELIASAADGGAAVLGALGLDGQLGCTGQFEQPAQAWRTGFLKSLAREWDPVRARAVDIGIDDPAAIAELLRAELFSADGAVEVGYGADGVRRTCKLRREPAQGTSEVYLDPASVVLVTGGARGITAESALALAVQRRCRLVLVGRTPMPAEPEPAATASLTGERDLKKAIFEDLSRDGAPPKPADIQARYSLIMKEREIRESLERFASAGVNFTYLNCDVADAAAFAALVDQVYERFGRIDGVIHGAGVIEDRLLADKSFDSFLRVYQTKVTSAKVLAAKLRPQTLKFLVFFSSVSGRFGNRGQADYASANEVLNKIAQKLDRAWPGRVVAIDWGPWHTTGMVTEEAKRQFASQGVGRIPVATGARMMIEEINAGNTSTAEVVVADLGRSVDQFLDVPAQAPAAGVSAVPFAQPDGKPNRQPLLNGARLEPIKSGIRAYRSFDPAQDLYLADHVLDDKPVVPFAIGMELMAEVARAGWPDMHVLEIRDIRMLNGIVVNGTFPEVAVEAQPLGMTSNGQNLRVSVSITSAGPRPRIHYTSTIEMGPAQLVDTLPQLVNGHFKPLESAEPLPWGIERTYDEWLFHGPIFEAIQGIDAISPSGATGQLRTSSPQDCLATAASGGWIIDPILVDAAFQMQVLWVRKHWDMTILPSSVASWRPTPGLNLSSFGGRSIVCELRTRPESERPISHTDFAFYSPDGQLLALISDLQATGSQALNRLSSRKTR